MESRRFVKFLFRFAFTSQRIKCEKMNKRGNAKNGKQLQRKNDI